MFNRFHVLHRSAGHSRSTAFYLVALFALVESASNLAGALQRCRWGVTGRLLRGRTTALWRIARLMVQDDGRPTTGSGCRFRSSENQTRFS